MGYDIPSLKFGHGAFYQLGEGLPLVAGFVPSQQAEYPDRPFNGGDVCRHLVAGQSVTGPKWGAEMKKGLKIFGYLLSGLLAVLLIGPFFLPVSGAHRYGCPG